MRIHRGTDREPGTRRPVPAGRGATLLAAAGAVTLLTVGCAAPAGEAGPADVVDAFYAAVGSDDAAGACRLLLPATAAAVAVDGAAPCEESLLDVRVTGDLADRAGGEVLEVHVAGRQAQVVMSEDTVFLARSGDSWIVTAAACEARPNRPYDCVVES